MPRCRWCCVSELETNLQKKWKDIAISYSGDYQIIAVENEQLQLSNNFGISWVPKELARSWQSVCISQNGNLQSAVAQFPFIEIFSSNKENLVSDINDYKAFTTGIFF